MSTGAIRSMLFHLACKLRHSLPLTIAPGLVELRAVPTGFVAIPSKLRNMC